MDRDTTYLVRYMGCLQRGDMEAAEKVRQQAAADGFKIVSPETREQPTKECVSA